MTLEFLALLGAPYIYIYDISGLRVKIYSEGGVIGLHQSALSS